MKVSLSTAMAPPFKLVVHFFIVGLVFLIIAVCIFPAMSLQQEYHFISLPLAAFSHLYLLGFVMMTIFGALYQLLPVILEVPLFSKSMAYVQFYLYCLGIIILVSGFAVDDFYAFIPYGALITYLSILIFCINVFLTFYALKELNVVGRFLLFGTFFLLIATTIGVIVSLHLGYGLFDIIVEDWINAHILGTICGFVMMVIMSVAMVLVPMFSLSHGYAKYYLEQAFYWHIFGVGFNIVVLLLTLKKEFLYVGLGALVVSCSLFIAQMVVILKKRARKQNDYWIQNIVFALFCLMLSVITLWQYPFLGAFFFLFGFLLPLIIGHMYKILPFLIWYEKFSPLVGKQAVPLLHQMIHTRVANIQTRILFLAIGVVAIGMIFENSLLFFTGSSLLILSILLTIYNIWYSFSFLVKE